MFFYSSNVNAICFLNCKTPEKYFLYLVKMRILRATGFDPNASGCVYNFGQKVKL